MAFKFLQNKELSRWKQQGWKDIVKKEPQEKGASTKIREGLLRTTTVLMKGAYVYVADNARKAKDYLPVSHYRLSSVTRLYTEAEEKSLNNYTGGK